MSVSDRRLVCAEALVRWDHPTRGLVLPVDFFPLVRENRQTDALTMSVLRTVAAQAADLRRRATPIPLALNLFPPTVGDLDLPARIKAELDVNGLPPRSLVMEITEEFVARDPDCALQVLRDLRGIGVDVSLDDFGSGSASLTSLHRLPVTIVKIDRALVSRTHHDPRTAALTKSIVHLAHSLGLEVVGEGVETVETLRALTEFGCDKAQGRYISRPLTASELTDWAARADLTLS